MEYTCQSPPALREIAGDLIRELGGLCLVLLRGELGAGKTALVQALCHELRVTDQVSSPTFSLINEYATVDGDMVYHIDLYRLETLDEALQIGIEDYLDSNTWCFVEWPELLRDILIPPYAVVEISVGPMTERKIRIFKVHAQDSNE
ncbi:MAG: tRNA (adenosine(37)-N6)-threonylcarbamoyltransferase complex ATPase subunit type 1 TsaE [Saprospiraceae bacterium]|nr:tRNA (adenosine(37)-N6)-threonylcarbamoyltransferase complex ATPase subunit type 1 TsaE [Saprospiraceae bacterium]